MHTVVRHYTGASATPLFHLLEQRKSDVEALLRTVPGLVSYTMLRTGDGGITVTVCQDKAGTDASVKVAREWIQTHAAHLNASPPAVMEGAVIVHING